MWSTVRKVDRLFHPWLFNYLEGFLRIWNSKLLHFAGEKCLNWQKMRKLVFAVNTHETSLCTYFWEHFILPTCAWLFSYSNYIFEGTHFVSEKEATVDIAPIVNKYVHRSNCKQIYQRKWNVVTRSLANRFFGRN